MALTDQPYFPLYVDDYLSDEKLNQCDPISEGIYIRLMCVLHKSKTYGSIEITAFDKTKTKQKCNKIKTKPEQKENIEILQELNVDVDEFYSMACKLQTMLGREINDVVSGLIDLIGNDVLQFSDGKIIQKRMKKDGDLSLIRANSRKKKPNKKNEVENKKERKTHQNSVYVYVNVNESVNEYQIEVPENLHRKEFLSVWDLWKIHRKKKHKFSFMNSDSESRKLKELDNLSGGDYKQAIKILQKGIDNGWKGFYMGSDQKPKKEFSTNRS